MKQESSKKSSVTGLILTYNESRHIARCINSIKNLVTDIVLVDSYSDDDTIEIAEDLGARVYQNTWVNYATQFQWGLDNGDIQSDWVMRIDADEYLENGMQNILTTLDKAHPDVTGITVKRKYFFLNKWMRFGSMYPIYVLRLWRKDLGSIENRWMDEHIILESGREVIVDANIVDDNKNSISWWINKHNGYATREMLDILNYKYQFLEKDGLMDEGSSSQAKTKRIIKEGLYNRLPIFVRPFLYFIYRYFFRLGFLDGKIGFAFHIMQGYWYRSLVDLKVLEAEGWINGETAPHKVREILREKTKLDL